MTESSERQLEAAERNVALETDAKVASIRAALLEEGEDVCVGCDRPIDAKRRAALPSAIRCIRCQAAFEGYSRGPR